MEKLLFAVVDVVSGDYVVCFCANNKVEAVRTFDDIIGSTEVFRRYPNDYCLYQVMISLSDPLKDGKFMASVADRMKYFKAQSQGASPEAAQAEGKSLKEVN